jgi:hypothetical protein
MIRHGRFFGCRPVASTSSSCTGPNSTTQDWRPRNQPLFVAFTVTDLDEAHREVMATGCEIGDVIWADEAFGDPELSGFGWFFFKAPDGLTYVIQQVPD